MNKKKERFSCEIIRNQGLSKYARYKITKRKSVIRLTCPNKLIIPSLTISS